MDKGVLGREQVPPWPICIIFVCFRCVGYQSSQFARPPVAQSNQEALRYPTMSTIVLHPELVIPKPPASAEAVTVPKKLKQPRPQRYKCTHDSLKYSCQRYVGGSDCHSDPVFRRTHPNKAWLESRQASHSHEHVEV